MYKRSSSSKFLTLKKALKKKNVEKVKCIKIELYTDSIFPNNDLLKFKSVEHVFVVGKLRLRKKKSDPLPVLVKIRIDTNKLNQLTNLKYLQFLYVDFGNFPVELCSLNHLKGLSLSFCNIDTLPKEISNLKSLEVLELRLNNIRFLPTEIETLNSLLVLDLINNSFTKLPKEILEIKSLKKINFTNIESPIESSNEYINWRLPYPLHTNKIGYVAERELFTNVLKCPQLQKICIAVENYDKKLQIKNAIIDPLLLKKICWEILGTVTADSVNQKPNKFTFDGGLGASYNNMNGNASKYFQNSFALALGIDFGYRNFFLKIEAIAPSNTHINAPFVYNNTHYTQDSTADLQNMNLNFGYACLNNKTFRLVPFVGIGASFFELGKSHLSLTNASPLNIGFDFDWKVKCFHRRFILRFSENYMQLKNSDSRFNGNLFYTKLLLCSEIGWH